MAIDKLNFSDINSGSKDFDTPLGSIADRLTKYGLILNQQDTEKAKQKILDEQDAYQKQRDTLADTRYNEQQSKVDAEKNRLLQKEYNTANAMQSVYNPSEYMSGRILGEKKAIEDSISNLSQDEQIIARAEVNKNYDPKASGQQWVDTALSQNNIDSSKIADLRMDMDKQRIQEERFAENKRLQEQQNAISAQSRADTLRLKERELNIQENKLKSPSKEDIKAAQTREGLYKEFKLNELKIPDSSLTNDQLENILKEEKQKISDIKKEKKELEKSGSFPFEEGKSISDQRKEFLSRNLLGTEGITNSDMNNYLKEDMNNIDRFLLDAEIKLGKKYNEKDILNRIASERKNQKIASPWDTRIQDALETVSEQIGLGETDY